MYLSMACLCACMYVSKYVVSICAVYKAKHVVFMCPNVCTDVCCIYVRACM